MTPTVTARKTVKTLQSVAASTTLTPDVGHRKPAPTLKTIAATTSVGVGALRTVTTGGDADLAPILGIWPASPTATVWTNLVANTAGNHILGYRPRGGYGQFDADLVPTDPPAGVDVYSTNLNPRTGVGDKTPISLVDWASGVYDSFLLDQVAPMNALIAGGIIRVIVEIWSESNVQDPLPSSQPVPPDWSTANWEAAFLHTVELWRDAGLVPEVWLGTSVSGLQSGFGEYITGPMIAASDFAGYDTYTHAIGTYHNLTGRVANYLDFTTAHDLPLIMCETGIDVTRDYTTWFADAYVFATTPGVAGIFYTDFNNSPKGDYRVDAGQPMHNAFVTFASGAGWHR